MLRLNILTVILLCCCCSLSLAWDGVSVLDASANLRWEQFVDSSPTPTGWTYWEASGDNGVDLVASYGDGHDEIFEAAWFACCTADSMVFQGSWPENDPDNSIWNRVSYDVVLQVHIYAEEGVNVVASREFGGNLSADEHSVTLTDSGDMEVHLLAGGTADEDEYELPPGTVFVVTIRIDAAETGTHYAYGGDVCVRFEDPDYVAVQALTLGAVKNLFR